MTTKVNNVVKALPATKSKAATRSLPTTVVANNKHKPALTGNAVTPTKVSANMANKNSVIKPDLKTSNIVKAGKLSKADKTKKFKMVRDSFSMPENDYSQFAALKKTCLLAGVHVKKSELLRAGLLCLSNLTDSELVKVVGQVEILKTGRPVKH